MSDKIMLENTGTGEQVEITDTETPVINNRLGYPYFSKKTIKHRMESMESQLRRLHAESVDLYKLLRDGRNEDIIPEDFKYDLLRRLMQMSFEMKCQRNDLQTLFDWLSDPDYKPYNANSYEELIEDLERNLGE